MFQLDIHDIIELHRNSIIEWKNGGISFQQQALLMLVEKNHAFNFQLWHAEDKARRDDLGFEYVYRAKREIDNFNQQRNNAMEAIDEWLFNELQPPSASICRVHSETPGMIIDRLSILALKTYHMDLQAQRQDVDDIHRQRCTNKLIILLQQKDQLQVCLRQIIEDVKNKILTFRTYKQFKMYNDPTLNPELYCQAPPP